MMLKDNRALVVFSGGQDSTTCLSYAVNSYGAENVTAISFNYGQRHAIELECAQRIAAMAGVKHHIVDVPPEMLQSSSPLTSDNELPKYADHESMVAEVGDSVEKTFVPMRNTLFLTIAANYAVANDIGHIYTGVCQEDNANYPDCTNDFIVALAKTFNLSLGLAGKFSNEQLQIVTPLMFKSKAETVELARLLPGCWDLLAYSHTSYDGKYPPTDNNHANILRAKGFEDAGLPDPLVERAWREGLMDLPATSNYDSLRGE